MLNSNNVNEGPISFSKNNNDNDNDEKYRRARQVDATADKLVEKLGLTHESRGFMCKVAWKLSESRIWDNFEKAMSSKKATNKVGLFIWMCKRDGV